MRKCAKTGVTKNWPSTPGRVHRRDAARGKADRAHFVSRWHSEHERLFQDQHRTERKAATGVRSPGGIRSSETSEHRDRNLRQSWRQRFTRSSGGNSHRRGRAHRLAGRTAARYWRNGIRELSGPTVARDREVDNVGARAYMTLTLSSSPASTG